MYYFLFYKVNILMFYNVQTRNSTFVGKNELYSEHFIALGSSK